MKRIHISAVKVPAVRDILGLVAFLSCSASGSRSSVGGSRRRRCESGMQPSPSRSWIPPGWVFGPIWSVLYPLIAVSGWTVWREGRSRLAVLLFLLQLALNAAWPWFFFGSRRLDWAFFDIVALTVTLMATIAVFYRIRRRAALLLVPYLAWVVFAAALNFAVWHLNP